jgi:hypothetical protein
MPQICLRRRHYAQRAHGFVHSIDVRGAGVRSHDAGRLLDGDVLYISYHACFVP